jgi:hypothetical protein
MKSAKFVAVGFLHGMQVYSRAHGVMGKRVKQHTIQKSFNDGVYISALVEIGHLPNRLL